MTLTTEHVVAIISAGSGLLGVVLGGFVSGAGSWLSNRSQRKANSQYLGILVIGHLDRLVDQCLAIANDDGYSYEGGYAEQRLTSDAPNFDPLSLNVEWKAISNELAYQIIQLPYQHERTKRQISGSSDGADFDSYVYARRKEYVKYGRDAAYIASHLRQACKLPPDNTWYERVKEFNAIEKRFKEQEMRNRWAAEEDAAQPSSESAGQCAEPSDPANGSPAVTTEPNRPSGLSGTT